MIGSKVIVIGCPGSGKSTFAKKLHEVTGLPLVHLDNIWWKADRTHISREEFDEKLEGIIEGESWIIDGNYSRTYEVRFKACDTVFFLDPGEESCMKGISERIGKSRSDIPWVESALDPELVELVRGYRKENRPLINDLIVKYPYKQVIVFKNQKEVESFLDSLAVNQT